MQIKTFFVNEYGVELEDTVNTWLKDNKDLIEIVDMRYAMTYADHSGLCAELILLYRKNEPMESTDKLTEEKEKEK